LQRTPRGRVVTAAAFEHLHIMPPDPALEGQQGRLF
jgi:Holliday junction resolvasome RuvABC ATP-dependent DNA helicase subunit